MSGYRFSVENPLTIFWIVLLLLLLVTFNSVATPPRAALPYRDTLIRNARLVWGLNAPIADFAAQIHHESSWKPDITNAIGAQGLAQFMPATTEWLGNLIPLLGEKTPFNPTWSIRALVHYDRWLWERVQANNGCEHMAMTLSAYNGGLGWVKRDVQLAKHQGFNILRWFGEVELVNAGRRQSAWQENRHYPHHILFILSPRYLAWGGGMCVR